MKRIWIFFLIAAAVSSANAQKKPNVVIMLGDNVGYGDIGAYGAGGCSGHADTAHRFDRSIRRRSKSTRIRKQ